MARHSRLVVPGIAAHIVQRGVNRQACFRGEVDYLVYLAILKKALERASCALHAYCLMTNHVHLLLTPTDDGACSRLMYEVGQRYVPYFNRRYERSGTLWEGRFRSCLVESREYVLCCYRYIEANPVRAGMVDSASAYRWSSHRGNTGLGDDVLLTPHIEYAALAPDNTARQSVYRALCDEREPADFVSAVRDATNAGLPLISEALKRELSANGSRVQRGKPGPRTDGIVAEAQTGGSQELDF